MKPNNSNSRLVYSTDSGSICPNCGNPKKSCICQQIKPNFTLAKFALRADQLNPFGFNCARRGNPDKISIAKFGIKRRTVSKPNGAVCVRYEATGRKGKAMTLITGLPLSEDDLLAMAKKLKQQFATGGAVKDFVIELQGDHREKAVLALRKLGYLV